MLTTCRVIFFIISACLFYICIKRKCLRTRVPPRDNVGGLCWLLPPPPSPMVESVESGKGMQFSARCRSLDRQRSRRAEGAAAFYPRPSWKRPALSNGSERRSWMESFVWNLRKEGLHCDFFTYRCKYDKYVRTNNLILLFVVRDNHGCKL